MSLPCRTQRRSQMCHQLRPFWPNLMHPNILKKLFCMLQFPELPYFPQLSFEWLLRLKGKFKVNIEKGGRFTVFTSTHLEYFP